jgi:molecular chaperone DnaK (HSP70)
VVLMRQDGPVLTGDAAQRRAPNDPDRVAREFKRRLGDPAPLILGGVPHSIASVLATLLGSVVGKVAEREGGPADRLVLTHPANWGPYKRELFESVPRLAEVGNVSMVTEPEAAAAHYATQSRVPTGAVVAVYDFGGGTFDATVLRKIDSGFEILGTPEGVEGLGGVDFDEAVYAHVDRSLGGRLGKLDPADPKVSAALVRLRAECVLAKEALSADTETTIPVLIGDLQEEVRLTRPELEEMIRPLVAQTVSSLRRALASASVEPDDVTTILLVGGPPARPTRTSGVCPTRSGRGRATHASCRWRQPPATGPSTGSGELPVRQREEQEEEQEERFGRSGQRRPERGSQRGPDP